MTSSDPKPEMIAFYEQRTREHIARVRVCLTALGDVTPYRQELLQRAELHDASKFEPEERIPYIWLTEFYRSKRDGEPFQYPEGMEARVRAAIEHHMSHNRHHPEYHADPNQMTDVDLIEMVCDWTAMAQEFHQCGGSARGWADRTIGKRVHFDDQRRAFVYEMIVLLDSLVNSDTKTT